MKHYNAAASDGRVTIIHNTYGHNQVYESRFDGVTACGLVFFWRSRGWSGKLLAMDATTWKSSVASINQKTWLLVDQTSNPPTCLACLGA